jgi:prepilin-type N-terminal cleavage/methylation domain-containing protein/prepilin-type processing-associated H-X9-DG protein
MVRRLSRGFTLIELMVVTTILGMLLSMLFPAVHATRMGMRRIACVNNLRNIGQATLRYVNSNKRNEFPGWRQAHQMPGVRWDATTLSDRLAVVSWGVTLLPYLDRDDLFRQFLLGPLTTPQPKKTAYLDVYVCPSDFPEARFDNPLSYVANCGLPDPLIPTIKPNVTQLTDSNANGVFHDLRPRYPKLPLTAPLGPDPFSELPSESFTSAGFIDGADKTLMFSEDLICPHYLGDPNQPEDPPVDVGAPTPTTVDNSPDPNAEEDTTTIPFRCWTGLRLLPLQARPTTTTVGYSENITLPAQVGNSTSVNGIQEWLIGMVWMPQPPLNPVAGSGEWSPFLARINQWSAGGSPLRYLGGNTLGQVLGNPSDNSGAFGSQAAVNAFYLNSRPASQHHAGVNVVFCDGHTGWLRQDIFYWVYMQLMTPDGMHACGHTRTADPPGGGSADDPQWYIARQYLGTQGQTPETAPLYILEDRDYK